MPHPLIIDSVGVLISIVLFILGYTRAAIIVMGFTMIHYLVRDHKYD